MIGVEWLEAAERKCFQLWPLRFVGDISKQRRAEPRAFVLVAGSGDRATIQRIDGSPSRAAVARAAEKLASRTGSPVVVAELAGTGRAKQTDVIGGEVDGWRPVWRSVARVGLAKAGERNPLTESGFDASVRATSERLTVFAEQEARHMTVEAMQWADFTWDDASEDEWARMESGMAGVFSNPSDRMINGQTVALAAALAAVIRGSQRATARMPGIRGTLGASFRLPDKALGAAFARHHGFFVRDQYGRIAPGLAAQARPWITAGLRDGLGRRAIGRDLRQNISGGLRMKGYWDTVAANAVNRARSYAQGATMRGAGIEFGRWESVQDENTTEFCKFMHGRLININGSMQRVERTLNSPDPEAVLWNSPMVYEGGGENGDEMYTELPDGERTVVARVVEPGAGTQGAGKYADGLPPNQMVEAGVGMPPAHHGCRSAVIPVVV